MTHEASDRAYFPPAERNRADEEAVQVPGTGRRRQARTPLRRRMRRDVLVWGVLAGVVAALVLGLTGGGWIRAIALGVLVAGGCAVLTLVAASQAIPTKGSPTKGSPRDAEPEEQPPSEPAP